jgi:putative acetyltransferase
MSVTIITFDPKFRTEFARLNYAWIKQLFAVEPIDQQVLDSPEMEILNDSGQIFFALEAGRVVGTVALKRIDPDRYELTKMAVDETYRGKGYGKQLLNAALAYARDQGAKWIDLSSHTSLVPAITMYREAGFIERKSDARSCYTRCNIYMEKYL